MADPLPVILSFRTCEHPPARRFSEWQAINAPSHTVTRPASDPPFVTDAFVCTFGDLVLSHARFSSQLFSRTSQHIRRDYLDHFALFAQGEGSRTLLFGPDETSSVAQTGDLIFCDLSQPGDSFATDGTSGTIYLPRTLVEGLLPAASDRHGTIVRGPIARLVAEHIHVVGGHMMHALQDAESHSPEPALASPHPGYHRLVRSTRELALSCLLDAFADPHAAAMADSRAAMALATRDDALRGAIIRHIDARLTDPALDIPSICAAFSLSRSALYRLFATSHDEGVARLIKRRRLARIRAVLLANQDPRPLAEIAGDYGFRTASHFSREFRAVFGYSPGELRQLDGDHPLGSAKRASSIDALFYTLSA